MSTDGSGDLSVADSGHNVDEGASNGQANQPAQAQRPSGWAMFKTLLVRMFFIYMISSMFRRSPQQPQQGKDGRPLPPTTQALNMFMKETPLVRPRNPQKCHEKCCWKNKLASVFGLLYAIFSLAVVVFQDLYVYLSEQEKFSDFDNPAALFWLEEELIYGDWTSGMNGDGSYEKKATLPISENVQNNGSIYMHVYFVPAGTSPNPNDDTHSERLTIYRSKRLNRYKKRKFHTAKNLLTGKTDAHPDLLLKENETNRVEILSTWHPNMTINIVDDHTPWVKGSVPQPLDEYIHFMPDGTVYQPIVYFNDYWNLNTDYMPINDTTPVLNLSLTYSPMSLFKWQMYAAQGMRNKWYSFMGEGMEESDDEQDSLKVTFLETNPYLLGLTIVVSIVHSVFEFLAFKNDIQFWKNRKSMEGLSVRSVFFNVFQSVIVVLYVMDNETNFVVRVSVFIGLAIEVWKIFKVLDFKLDRENKLFGVIPKPTFEDKSTYTESNTKQYDMLAFKYLSWLLFPLLGGYAVYSLMYVEQKGWYSWVLNMIYGFLLTFGFIMMTPQLFINYKLKSVAHLPWRMLTYKALNTFIDDLFAFVIKMPTLYRLGCFRDDIVFLIFLYQRYIYRVDPKRVNEFGTSQETWEQNGPAAGEEEETTQEAIENTADKTAQEKKED